MNEYLNKTTTGDNVALCRRLPGESIDLVVTSPPYDDMGADLIPGRQNKIREYDGYEWDFVGLAAELWRVIKPGGVVVWVVNDPSVDGGESLASARQKIYFSDLGFRIHDTMIYQKAGPAHPSRNRYYQVFEYVFVLSKGEPKTYNPIADRKNKWFGEKWSKIRSRRKANGELKTDTWNSNEGGEYGVRFNIWKYAVGYGYHGDDLAHEHPASFPEALAQDHILSWSNPGDLVLDPFMGSGTVAKMAIQTGRTFIGFEISEKYTKLANRRVHGANLPLFAR